MRGNAKSQATRGKSPKAGIIARYALFAEGDEPLEVEVEEDGDEELKDEPVTILKLDDKLPLEEGAMVEERERLDEGVAVGMSVIVPMVLVVAIVSSGALATLDGTASVRVNEGTGDANEPVMADKLSTATSAGGKRAA